MLSVMVLFNSLKNKVYSLLLYALSKQKSSVIFKKVQMKLPIDNVVPIKMRAVPKPMRIWIDGKCFNVPVKKRIKNFKKTEADFINDLCNKNDVTFITKENGLITINIKLPVFYYKKLKFQIKNDVKSIMDETNTHIYIPKVSENDTLRILGDNKQQVKKSFHEILSLIATIRNESRPLQFLSIPLCNEEIKRNFMKFKKKVLQERDLKGVDESIFISPLKLHLTVNVMVLLDESEKREAIRALHDYRNTVLMPLLENTGSLKIRVSGIECMNNKYEKVNVLYAKAKINETGTTNLQNIVNGLSDYFYERGLLKQHQENITVHMTLMNTKYREDAKSPQNSRYTQRFTKKLPFDARIIMEKFKNFEFGTCDLNNIRISIMSSIDKTGFYESLATIEV